MKPFLLAALLTLLCASLSVARDEEGPGQPQLPGRMNLASLPAELRLVHAYTAGDSNAPQGEASDQFTNPNTPIQVTAGQVFTISLKSNHTTGFAWQLDPTPDPDVVTLVSDTYESAQSGFVGTGGKEIWTFRAVGQGKTTLHFNYARSWESDKPPAQTLAFQVDVAW